MISFTAIIHCAPVTKNFRGTFDRKHGHKFVPKEAKVFMQRVRAAVREAMAGSGWPLDPFLVDHARISIFKYNTKADASAGTDYILDALEYRKISTKEIKESDVFGLYFNDRIVSLGDCPRPQHDGSSPRIEIRCELLGLCSPAEAHERRERWQASEDKRVERRRQKAREARDKRKQSGKVPA